MVMMLVHLGVRHHWATLLTTGPGFIGLRVIPTPCPGRLSSRLKSVHTWWRRLLTAVPPAGPLATALVVGFPYCRPVVWLLIPDKALTWSCSSCGGCSCCIAASEVPRSCLVYRAAAPPIIVVYNCIDYWSTSSRACRRVLRKSSRRGRRLGLRQLLLVMLVQLHMVLPKVVR